MQIKNCMITKLKTVTAKFLANKLGLPVIICDRPYVGLAQFLASINHDCVFFFDEFEKNFRLQCGDDEECAGEDLLSIMDGVYNTDNCHVFILTTNELRINDNLICRPSRIRYLKTFDEVIDKKILNEFIDDNLKYPEYKNEILEFVEGLTICTIDIVKTIIDEVNLHNCSVNEFRSFFNVKESEFLYSVRTWRFCGCDKEGLLTKEDFLSAVKAGYMKEIDYRPNYDTLCLKKSIKKLKVGDMITSIYKIKELDLINGYVLGEHINFQGKFSHYFIENPDAQPNIFNKNVYGYGNCDNEYWD